MLTVKTIKYTYGYSKDGKESSSEEQTRDERCISVVLVASCRTVLLLKIAGTKTMQHRGYSYKGYYTPFASRIGPVLQRVVCKSILVYILAVFRLIID